MMKSRVTLVIEETFPPNTKYFPDLGKYTDSFKVLVRGLVYEQNCIVRYVYDCHC